MPTKPPPKPLDVEAARDLIGLLRLMYVARGRHDPPHRAFQERIAKLAKELTAAMADMYAAELGTEAHDAARRRLDALLGNAVNAGAHDGLERLTSVLDVALDRVRTPATKASSEDDGKPPKWVLRQMRG